MAGGRGTRFWPLSRNSRPKHLLKILSPKSLIRATVDRISPLIGLENILVVTTSDQIKEIRRELHNLPRNNFLQEPQGKNTAPCIGLAAIEVMRRDQQAIMTILPADHWILDTVSFRKTLTISWKLADLHNCLLTIGIQPRYPETGYGYILKGKAIRGPNRISAYRVKAFKEKPMPKEAQRLVRSGSLWNSGIFIGKASTILAMIESFAPKVYRGLQRIQNETGGKSLTTMGTKVRAILQREYRKMPNLSIDHGVLEKAGSKGMVLTIESDCGWSDIGSWASLHQLLPHDPKGNAALGKWVGLNSRDCLVYAPDRLVVLLGMHEVMVVDTPDAILVGDINRAQEMREIVKMLELKGYGRIVREFSR